MGERQAPRHHGLLDRGGCHAVTKNPFMSRILQPILNLVRLVLSQAIVLGGFVLVQRMGWRLPLGLFEILLIQGVLSALIGRLLGLWWFWMPVQILLPFAVVYNDVVPAWAYGLAFIACVLVFWNGAKEQVPFYMTNRQTWKAIGDLVARENARSVADLGSGAGGIVTFLAKHHPTVQVDGYETAPLLTLVSKLWVAFIRRPNAAILYESLWDADLSQYDVVYCFLSPVPMPGLYEKAKAAMRPGTILVSNSFEVPGVAPVTILEVDDARRTRLFLYRF